MKNRLLPSFLKGEVFEALTIRSICSICYSVPVIDIRVAHRCSRDEPFPLCEGGMIFAPFELDTQYID